MHSEFGFRLFNENYGDAKPLKTPLKWEFRLNSEWQLSNLRVLLRKIRGGILPFWSKKFIKKSETLLQNYNAKFISPKLHSKFRDLKKERKIN